MRALRILMAAPLLGLGLASTTAHAAPAAFTTFQTTLTPQNEVGAGDPNGSGTAKIEIDAAAGQLCYTLGWKGIQPNAAHIHLGPKGTAGDIVVPLTAVTTRTCKAVDGAVLNGIANNPRNYYVNLHTMTFPAGAIRGQVDPS